MWMRRSNPDHAFLSHDDGSASGFLEFDGGLYFNEFSNAPSEMRCSSSMQTAH
jgi:hypothetical protein